MTLADRVFTCGCGHSPADRDTNAATNLARWGQQPPLLYPIPGPPATGPGHHAADGTALTNTLVFGETSPNDAETDVPTAPAA